MPKSRMKWGFQTASAESCLGGGGPVPCRTGLVYFVRKARSGLQDQEGSNSMIKTPILLSVCGALALSACTTDPFAYPDDPNARAKSGAIVGALTGAVLGASVADDNKGRGAIIGAGLGALTGAAIGNELDKQASELRNSLSSSIGVTNYGDYLVVNMPQDVLFAVDSATLRPDLTRDLGTVASSLIRYPNSRIEVVGHTDNTGAAAYNQDLSQRRAQSVAGVLQGNGVPGSRISAFGRGEDLPVATNLTPQGQALNHRVEINIRPTT